MSQKEFFHFWPLFVQSVYKLLVLICHKVYLIPKFKMSSNIAHLSSVKAKNERGCFFFHFWPRFVHSAYKLSILIHHKVYFIRKLKISSHMILLSSANAKNSRKWARTNFSHFQPYFGHSAYKLSILVCYTTYLLRKCKMSSETAHLSSINIKNWRKMSQKHFFPILTPSCS